MMSPSRRILFSLLLCVVSFACSRVDPTVFDAVPRQATLILETPDLPGFLQTVEGKPYLEPFFVADEDLSRGKALAYKLDTMLKVDPELRARVYASQMVLASVPTEGGNQGLLVAKMYDKVTESDLKRIMKANEVEADARKNGEAAYYFLRDQDSLYVFQTGPFLGMSRSADLVERVFHQLTDEERLPTDLDFQRVQQTLGQHVKAHLYYHDPRGWMALDVLPGEQELVMNGYALAADSLSSLRPLKYQLPVKNSVINVLPFDTKFMLHYGMSDYASYWQSFRDVEAINAFNKRYGLDVEPQLLNHLSEVSFVAIGKERREVCVARMTDPSAVIKFMERLAAKTGIKASTDSQGYVLYDLGEREVVPTVFGPAFKSIKRCCYAIVDQYLVLAPDFNALQWIIACYRSGRTLDLNENFKNFQQQMLESSNITLYVTGEGNQPLVKAMTDGVIENFLDRHPKLLNDFHAASVQLASSKDLVYTNICLVPQGNAKDESNIRWKVNLEAPLQGKPFIVPGPSSDLQQVVAFDRQNKMYLIDSEGKVLWTKELAEPPVGMVFAVDAEKNGQTQLLFNTGHTLQLVNSDGSDHAPYPVQLPFEASNGLSVFDYHHDKDYRILLCGKDKLVYNYDIHGEEVEGWNRHRSEDLVTLPVKHITADEKDYLVVSDVNGGVRILDRQGRIRIPLSSDMQKSPQADLYANATNRKKGLFLTSDKEGKLLYVTSEGNLNRTDFGDYSPRHFFLYEDFNADQDPDFIFLDGKDLVVFDRFKKELFSYHFDVDITTKPVFFSITRNKRLLGIVSEKAREIYLIDRKGKMIVNAGLVGETPFAVGSLHNEQEINLITGVGNALFNYVIY